MELGLKIEDAVRLNKELEEYVFRKNGKTKIDFKNKDALYLYNKTILKHLFDLDMEFHKNALIPTPINRYLFVKNVFDEKIIDHPIKTVLEIGTGSGIISMMIAKYYNCKVYATETVKEYINRSSHHILKYLLI